MAVKCRFCGEKLPTPAPSAFPAAPGMSRSTDLPKFAQEYAWVAPVEVPETKQWNPGIAAVLSLFLPGAGQMYKGRIGRGLAWLAGTAIGYMAMVVSGVVVHIVCIYNAYSGEID
jgi:TM2 domain-containing membrane protein YozV